MKFISALFWFILTGMTAMAQSVAGDVTEVDVATKTISISVKAGPPKLYHLRLTAEVQLNGAKATLADLSVGMSARITSGDPGYASKIEATGTAQVAGAPAVAGDLEKRLLGTKWIWFESKDTIQTLHFEKDGVATWNSGKFTWKVSPGGGNRIEGATSWGAKYKMTFDETLTTTTIYWGSHPAYKSKRADK